MAQPGAPMKINSAFNKSQGQKFAITTAMAGNAVIAMLLVSKVLTSMYQNVVGKPISPKFTAVEQGLAMLVYVIFMVALKYSLDAENAGRIMTLGAMILVYNSWSLIQATLTQWTTLKEKNEEAKDE